LVETGVLLGERMKNPLQRKEKATLLQEWLFLKDQKQF